MRERALQLSLLSLPPTGYSWLGSPVGSVESSLDAVREWLPVFDRRPFAMHRRGGVPAPANPRYDAIVRRDGYSEMPVGIVSKQYTLVQHTDVLDTVVQELRGVDIEAEAVKARLELTEYGERMALHCFLPRHYYDSGDGHPMELRLTCFNSVEGSLRLCAFLGWFRFVCSNGLIVGQGRVQLRQAHHRGLDLGRIGPILRSGLEDVTREKRQFSVWQAAQVRRETLAAWVDGPLCERSGALAAARAYHIALTGHDADRFLDRWKQRKPTERRVACGPFVPGAVRASNVYDVSQALAWLAKERGEFSQQVQRMEQIPSLLRELLKAARRGP
jgi:hypothetical protein